MSKRKADEQNPRIFSIQQELTKCTTSINEGTYPALVQINDSLLGAKQRRQSMADKHRKMQIKNINDLYDYELRDIHSQYMDAYEAAQAR